jgi:hypothetical protein
VLDVLRRYKRAQGQEMRLNQLDLRRQMATQPYWLTPKDGIHRKRFENANPEGCWGIDLDHHPMGRRLLSDEEWERLRPQPGLGVISGDWADPRHGDLFAIASKLPK